MDDKTLVERLDTAIKDDHERGCQGRYYSCTCGYDNDCSQAMQDAKSRIEALEAALRKSPLIGSTEDAAAFRKREDEWYKKYYLPLMESQP